MATSPSGARCQHRRDVPMLVRSPHGERLAHQAEVTRPEWYHWPVAPDLRFCTCNHVAFENQQTPPTKGSQNAKGNHWRQGPGREQGVWGTWLSFWFCLRQAEWPWGVHCFWGSQCPLGLGPSSQKVTDVRLAVFAVMPGPAEEQSGIYWNVLTYTAMEAGPSHSTSTETHPVEHPGTGDPARGP